MTVGDVLTPRESRLLAAIAENTSATQEDLAGKLGITPRHVRRLLERDRVQQELDIAARAGLRSATALLGRNTMRAARALVGIAGDVTAPRAARVAACRAIFEGASRLLDVGELEARILALESARSAATTWRQTQ